MPLYVILTTRFRAKDFKNFLSLSHFFYCASRCVIKEGLIGRFLAPLSITSSIKPYSTASWGCKYLTRQQSWMTLISYPFTTSRSKQFIVRGPSVVGNLLGLDGNIGRLTTSLRTVDLTKWWHLTRQSDIHVCPARDNNMAGAPKACPRATVCTGGRTYFITSARANTSVSNPTACPVAVVVLDELLSIGLVDSWLPPSVTSFFVNLQYHHISPGVSQLAHRPQTNYV